MGDGGKKDSHLFKAKIVRVGGEKTPGKISDNVFLGIFLFIMSRYLTGVYFSVNLIDNLKGGVLCSS